MDLRKFFTFRGIKVRILAPVILFFLAGTSVMLFLHYQAMNKISYQTGLKQANALLESVRVAIDFPMTVGDEESVRRILAGLEDNAKVYIADPEGKISYAPVGSEEGKKLWELLPEEVAGLSKKAMERGSNEPMVEMLTHGDSGELIGIRLIRNHKKCFHCHGASKAVLGMMVMRSDISSIIQAEHASLKTIIALVVAALALAIPTLVFILNKSAIMPMRNLADRLKELATGEADLTKELEVRAIDCASVMGCGQESCPSFGKKSHCWYESGSYATEVHCPKITSGTYASCEECKDVYQRAIITEVDEAATFVNGFIVRIRELISKVKFNSDQVGEESEKVRSESVEMSAIADETSQGAQSLLQAAEVTSDMVTSVVTAMEEMNSTVVEISQNTSQSREMAFEANEKAKEAAQVIENLSDASDKIGEISQLIGSIAEQTNLLALNATIEAARAGEAGKGFAVVANEVKELAKQTGDSVVGIDQSVQGLKNGVGKAVDAISEIVSVIEQLTEMAEGIASAVEEQTATTNELSANAQSTGETVQEMTAQIKNIADSSVKAQEGSRRVKEASEELQTLFRKLHAMLDEFKV